MRFDRSLGSRAANRGMLWRGPYKLVLAAILTIATSCQPPPTYLEDCESNADCGEDLSCVSRMNGELPYRVCTMECSSSEDCPSRSCLFVGSTQDRCDTDGHCNENKCD